MSQLASELKLVSCLQWLLSDVAHPGSPSSEDLEGSEHMGPMWVRVRTELVVRE